MDRREFIGLAAALSLGMKDRVGVRTPRHVDARTLTDGSLIEGEVCIVGAGAAGISIAMELAGSPHDVVLLEGGGFNVEAQMQDLYAGEIIGQPYYPLRAARLHVFGGTTGHWAGFCSPYDALDFEKREWVPHSGWPFSREELDPYYERAQPLLELGPYRYDAGYWEELDPDVVRMPLDEKVAWTKMWQFSPPTRFGSRYREAVVKAPNVRLYTYANVVEVEANESVTAVEGLRVRTIDGREHRVQARYYVLACGAIQNARMLLASRGHAPGGLGNDHDLVGRFFMDHFEMPSAHLVLAEPQPMKMYAIDFGVTQARGELSLSPQTQRAHAVLNGTASLQPGALDGEITSTFQNLPPEIMERLRTSTFDRRDRPPTPSSERVFRLFTRQEQAPNRLSRVLLDEDIDAMGMPRVKLDWQFTLLDKRSMRTFYEVLGREVAEKRLGEVRIMDWLREGDDASWPSFLSGGWHHMGTTRMNDDPKQGVADSNSRVHGLGNLFVAGSGVFPTSGAANPTLTLVAMSLRLADHLRRIAR